MRAELFTQQTTLPMGEVYLYGKITVEGMFLADSSGNYDKAKKIVEQINELLREAGLLG